MIHCTDPLIMAQPGLPIHPCMVETIASVTMIGQKVYASTSTGIYVSSDQRQNMEYD